MERERDRRRIERREVLGGKGERRERERERMRRDVHRERGSTSSGERGTPSVLKRRGLGEGEGRTDRPGGG